MSDDNLAPETVDLDSKDLTNVSFTSELGILSDLHARSEDKEELIHQIRNAVEKFNKRNISKVIILGDVIHESENREEDINRLQRIVDVIHSADFDSLFVPGNHDVAAFDIETFLDIVDQDDDYGTFKINRSLDGIYLNSSSPEMEDSRGYIPEDQIEFLKNTLDDTEKQNIIFSHHPIHYHEIPNDSWFKQHPECVFAHNKYKVEEVVSERDNVLATVNGHAHIGNIVKKNETVNITASAMNYYMPTHEGLTGYHSVLEVSECRIEFDEYTPLDLEETHYQTSLSYIESPKIALGGTFDPIHNGHKDLFRSAFTIGDLVVGLTSDSLAPKTRHEERFILPFNERKATLQNVLSGMADKYGTEYDIRELNNPEGVVTEDESVTHLVVSPETVGRSLEINKERMNNGYDPLKIEVIEPERAEDGDVLSSTRICKGEIDVNGNLTPNAQGREPIK